MQTYFMVIMLESEKGWGERIDDVLYFSQYEVASDFVKKYNNKWNDFDSVPDWYIQAQTPKPVYAIPEGKKVCLSLEDTGYLGIY